MKNLNDAEAAERIALFKGGMSTRQIARERGLSREAIAQSLIVRGLQPSDFIRQRESERKHRAVDEALRLAAEHDRINDLAESIGVDDNTLRAWSKEQGAYPAIVERLRAGRKRRLRERQKNRVARELVALARVLRRTPGMRDLCNAGLCGVWGTAIKCYGSMSAAQIAAGLPPRGRGGAGHVDSGVANDKRRFNREWRASAYREGR